MIQRFCFLIMLILLISCDSNKSFRITGNVSDNSIDGQLIYIRQLKNNRIVDLDSVMVQDSKFLFKGEIDSATICELYFEPPVNSFLSPLVFVLEPAKMSAFIDTLSYMKGTEENENLYEHLIRERNFKNRLEGLAEHFQLLNLMEQASDSVRKKFYTKHEAISLEMNAEAYQFVKDNNQSMAGGLVFLQSYSLFSRDQALELLENGFEGFNLIEGIQIIRAQFKQEETVAVGMHYKNSELRNIAGEIQTLDHYIGTGEWVLLDFWASWCTPCREELSYLRDAYNTYASKGFTIVGISIDSQENLWKKGAQERSLNWVQLSELKGWDSKVVHDYAIYEIPYAILIDPDGIIRAKGLRKNELIKFLDKVLK